MPATTYLRSDAAATLRYQPLVVVLAATCAGIVVDRALAIRFGVEWFAAVGLWAAWLVAHLRRRPRIASVALLAAAGAIGAAWHHASWRLFDADDLASVAGLEPRAVLVEATVVDAPRSVVQPSGYDPAKTEIKTRFEIVVHALRDGATWRRAAGRADVQLDDALDGVAAGDRVHLLGRVARSPPPLNPGEFDFAEHYRAERKLCVVRAAGRDAVTVVERRSTGDVSAWLSDLRRRGHERLMRYVPAAQSGFASALLLGYRDQLDRRENWAFFRTGSVHILSISGLHIGILAMFLQWALRIGWLRQGTALVTTMLVTTTYATVIDAEPPAVRAALTVVLVTSAALVLRQPLGGNVLAAAALLVLAQNPSDLFRAGPQLSFLAAAVLASGLGKRPAHVVDPLEQLAKAHESRLRRFVRETAGGLGRMLLVSTAIFATAMPLVAHKFHIVSPIALVLTPLVALPTATALLFGFLTLTLGAIVPPLASVFGLGCGASLALCEWLVAAAECVPYGWFWLPGPAAWPVGLFYGLLAVGLLIPRGSRGRLVVGLAAMLWGVVSMVPHHRLPTDVATRVTFISVGHGLSVLVEERDGPTWLYDCGRMGSPERGAQSIAGVLWTRGITRLDFVVVSHTDADHYNALPYLLEQFRVARLYASPQTLDSSDPGAEYIRATAAAAGVPVTPLVAGDAFLGDLSAAYSVLHPPPAGVVGNDNAQSIVIDIVSRGRRILLTGDLEGAGLAQLLARPKLECDVLSAPHHGSVKSNTATLANWSTPEFVVISGDEDRRGTVRAVYKAIGATTLVSTSVGAVTADIGTDGTLRVSTFRKP
jgi:competence protein ComEC